MMPSYYDPVPENVMPRFAGLATFMNMAPLQAGETPDIVVVGAPFDGGTTMRPGARMGPRALREASHGLYPYHRVHRHKLTDRVSVADGGDLFVVATDIVQTLEHMTRQLRILGERSRILMMGGDHSVTLAPLRAARERYGQPLALIHLDAHSDLWDTMWGGPYNHATVFRRAVEEGLIDPAHSIQVGMRGSLEEAAEDQFGDELGIVQISTDQWLDQGNERVQAAIAQRVGQWPAYVSVDIDVVDPAFACGTGTPEAGGPSSYTVLSLLRLLPSLVVGADVVELAPDLDVTRNSALFAASVAYELLFLLAHGAGY